MRCPFCLNDDSQVKDSRPTEDGSAIRRRRQCPTCGARFTTFERVQLREIVVLKKSGRREPFERDKLARSVAIACRKRPVSPEQMDRMVTGVVRRLESLGDIEVDAGRIGQLVMEGLQALDPVAYIRFASVYKEFREPADFEAFVGQLDETARVLAREGKPGQADLPGLGPLPGQDGPPGVRPLPGRDGPPGSGRAGTRRPGGGA